MPAILAERRGQESRWVLFARIEPGVSTESVESTLASRLEEVLTPPRVGAGLEVLDADSEASEQAHVGSAETSGDWPPGPEYRVQSDRAHSVYRAQVRRALHEIEGGRLRKVVVARSLRVDHDGVLDVPAFLERLRPIYPSCTLVALGRGHDTFLAATPETLVRLEGTRVRTAALAGSAPRGRTPEEDRLLGDALLASPKDRAEHEHVVEAIRDVLGPLCGAIEVPGSPRLRGLFGIQHLETPIRGVLRSAGEDAASRPRAADVLDLVAALHPTPAVGGVPGPCARDWLRRFEALDRGWYAAPIGWLDAEGGGDFRVALRSALVRNGLARDGASGGSRARLFAGAGIVAGSHPEQELVETRIKLRALLAPLTEI
jgi:isochorismate synthase